ncbi:hypothetical protein PI125_g19913 [Phytophthora idaei]|nr:hypothetical protein PI125_g19913 [Phytophthora idaei]
MESAGRRENVPPHDTDGGSWRSDLSDLQSTKVEAIGQSGTNEKDMIEESYLLYKTEYKRRFQYIDCYNELADCPKFEKILGRGTKHHAETSDDSSDPNGADGPSSQTRRSTLLRRLNELSDISAPPLSDQEDASATVGQSTDQIVASSPAVVNPISIADLCFQTDS